MRRFLVLSVVFGAICHGGLLWASHHFETRLARLHPQFDLTDLFIFESTRPDHTVMILCANPQTKETAAFGEGGLYNIHLSKDEELSGGKTFTFRASNGHLVVGLTDSANPPLGVEGKQIGDVRFDSTTELENGIRIWAGAARDPFVGNSDGIQKFNAALRNGKFDSDAFSNGVDLFKGLNSSVIVMEVPDKMLPEKVWVYATTAINIKGQWLQVNRWGHVLFTHLFLLGDETLSADHSAHRPDDDGQRQLALSSIILRGVSLAGSKDEPVAYADQISKRLLPDMIPYRVGTKAVYGVEEFNGRRTTDDAMDVALTLFSGALTLFSGQEMTDHANTFDRHPQEFPYVVPVKMPRGD